MAYYKKHSIKAGETVQSIANKYLSDASQWMSLVEFNSLVYPYIVSTREAKMSNPDHLLTTGDSIVLPTANQESDLNFSTMTEYDQKNAYDMSMGMDIDLVIPDYDDIQNILVMHESDDHHDVATVSGISNLKNSIRRRLLTSYGSLLYHPDYGTHLLNMIGEKINDNLVEDVKVEILRTVKTDPRVSDVKIKTFDISVPNKFFCLLDITPITGEYAFEMFVENAQSGKINVG